MEIGWRQNRKKIDDFMIHKVVNCCLFVTSNTAKLGGVGIQLVQHHITVHQFRYTAIIQWSTTKAPLACGPSIFQFCLAAGQCIAWRVHSQN